MYPNSLARVHKHAMGALLGKRVTLNLNPRSWAQHAISSFSRQAPTCPCGAWRGSRPWWVS